MRFKSKSNTRQCLERSASYHDASSSRSSTVDKSAKGTTTSLPNSGAIATRSGNGHMSLLGREMRSRQEINRRNPLLAKDREAYTLS